MTLHPGRHNRSRAQETPANACSFARPSPFPSRLHPVPAPDPTRLASQADATNPAINPDDANLFTDTEAVVGNGVNQLAPFPGGNKARRAFSPDDAREHERLKRAMWEQLDPVVRKRNGLDVNLITHDRPTRGLAGGIIELI